MENNVNVEPLMGFTSTFSLFSTLQLRHIQPVRSSQLLVLYTSNPRVVRVDPSRHLGALCT